MPSCSTATSSTTRRPSSSRSRAHRRSWRDDRADRRRPGDAARAGRRDDGARGRVTAFEDGVRSHGRRPGASSRAQSRVSPPAARETREPGSRRPSAAGSRPSPTGRPILSPTAGDRTQPSWAARYPACDSRNTRKPSRALEAMSPHRRFSDSDPDRDSGGCGCPHPASPRSRCRPTTLASARVVAPASRVYPIARGLADRRDRQLVRGVVSIPPLHLGVGRWGCRVVGALGVRGAAQGADVPRVARVVPGRRQLAGMGHSRDVRLALRAAH
jgi:hypothetical protein